MKKKILIFEVDVGNMPKSKGDEYVRDISKRVIIPFMKDLNDPNDKEFKAIITASKNGVPSLKVKVIDADDLTGLSTDDYILVKTESKEFMDM